MKAKYYITFFITAFYVFCFSQEDLPSNAISHFEEYPVDLSTGLPKVNIPLGVLPSRAGNIDVALNYHPSAVAVFNQQLGDAGHGWNLYKGGGVVSKLTVSSTVNVTGTYAFSFMGFSGKIEVKKVGNNMEARLVESTSEYLKVYISSSSNDEISRFKFIDNAGNSYIFGIYDTSVYKQGLQEKHYRNIYHLTEIRTPANILAATYSYETKLFNLNNQIKSSSVNIVKKIISHDFGEINFSYLILSASGGYPITRYHSFSIKDFKEDIISQFNFIFGTNNYTTNMAKLIQVDKLNGLSPVEKQSYFFYYALGAPFSNKQILKADNWGYYSVVSKYCQLEYIAGLPNKNTITNSILRKITYPTGASVIYDYEPNTYSYNFQGQLDSIKKPSTNQFELDPLFFKTISGNNGANNLHNYTKSIFQSKTFNSLSAFPLSFNVSIGKGYYFKFDAEPWEVTGLVVDYPDQIVYMYPNFVLKKNGAVIYTFSGVNSWNPEPYGWDNDENNCLGKNIFLTAGNYTLEMSHPYTTSGRVEIYSMNQNSNIKKWWYGGGIRIKTIGYFDDPDVHENYFNSGMTEPAPARRIDYDYNLFDEPDRSSGYLKNLTGNNFEDLVRYKNVTVYDSYQQGKKQYEFFTPLNSTKFIGIKKVEKLFDTSNQLVRETLFKYSGGLELIPQSDWSPTIDFGTVFPNGIITRTYQGNQYIEEVSEFTYNMNRQLSVSASKSSISGDVVKQKYFYNTSENITLLFSSYQSLLERTEKYLNNQFLHSSAVIYSEEVLDDEAIYLQPEYTESSKNGTDYKVVSKVNLYDSYSNIIEYENEQGTKIVNIWGYNKTKIVAKIENISYSQIPQNLITAIQTASNGTSESSLLTALNNLRNHSSLANSLVATYTYKPLIGVSTETDYRGRRTSYFYDGFGRLKEVRDHNNNILTEKEYYYQPQN